MGMTDGKQPSRVLRERLREIRERRGMSQRDLADEMVADGWSMHQVTIARTEQLDKKPREVTLDEALGFALALNISPLHLFVPTNSHDTVELAPKRSFSADAVRRWVRGSDPIPGLDLKYYFEESSDEDMRKLKFMPQLPALRGALDDLETAAAQSDPKAARAAVELCKLVVRTLELKLALDAGKLKLDVSGDEPGLVEED